VSGPGVYVAVLLYTLPGLVIGAVIHELTHAALELRFGDPTPRRDGRMTIEPRRHLDPFGTTAFLIAGIGWCRPVFLDPRFIRRPVARAVIALAGPASHLAVAAIFALALRAESLSSGIDVSGFLTLSQFTAQGVLLGVLLQGFLVNIAYFVFNILPLPGLDGYTALRSLLFGSMPRLFLWMEQYRVALYAAVIVVTVALPQLTRGLVNPLATATIGTATLLYAHAVEPGVSPLFLGLPNVFTLF
jgi:Zn-dependent protease